MNSDIHKIVWERMELKPGKNQIYVIGYKNGKQCTDGSEWNFAKSLLKYLSVSFNIPIGRIAKDEHRN